MLDIGIPELVFIDGVNDIRLSISHQLIVKRHLLVRLLILIVIPACLMLKAMLV